MIKIIPVALFFLSFFASLVSNAWLRLFSKKTNILIDRPDKYRKFHDDPTPLTGGLGISIGIIFSGIFLLFLTDVSYISEVSSKDFLGNQPSEKITHTIKTTNEEQIIIERISDESYSIVLPDGNKYTYKIENNNESFLVSSEYINDKIVISNFSFGLIFFTLLVQILMIADDLWSLKATTRLILQAICVGGLIFVSGVYIESLGNLIGFGEILLGPFGIPFTIFCVVGMMNAFNMIDGLNGLCASLCLVCYVAMLYMINANSIPSLFPLILPVGAIIGFLMFNLGILGNQRTVFLGDNGSNALGFMCAWILVYFSNIEGSNFAPVTALWLVAIPFIDAVGVMISRTLKGVMPLRPGRDHLHHKLLDLDFSSEMIYSILILLSGFLAFIGLTLNSFINENHYYSFYAFLFISLCYYFFTRLVQKNV